MADEAEEVGTKAIGLSPHWGRLHQKWGEALHHTGRENEAKKQFTLAASLYLAPSEKIERARINHG